MKTCVKCGSHDIKDSKIVTLAGQPWEVYNDGYRFWLKPAEGNPLVDRSKIHCMEYKHNDGPAFELAELFFSLLPDGGSGSNGS